MPTLQAVRYRVNVNAYLYGKLSVTNDEPMPVHFVTPYQLRVNAGDVGLSGR